MNVIDFDSIKHMDMLLTWYSQWGIPVKSMSRLSDTGLIIENVCALWLYKTNSSVCIIENLICNRELSMADRDKGLDLIFNQIIQLAKDLGFKESFSLVKNEKVIDRVIEKNCRQSSTPYFLMTRSL